MSKKSVRKPDNYFNAELSVWYLTSILEDDLNCPAGKFENSVKYVQSLGIWQCIHLPAWKPICGINVYFRGKLTSKQLEDTSQAACTESKGNQHRGENITIEIL